ncbi:5-methyltetrahydropteroyltriglutamate--homocysteine S-methyltransferase [Ligilactobacillus ruminis]|uniref:5-methyltetrahydropteroyltriglutamate-- homocysteine S-methyltransferase n=1 Tax=Ligilactobacillus ruminis TaxID=1623 RepID=UPI00107FFFB7|nr:5-methyltetrahydropteroyltriglutamate--homocysteine S-methyltransferase [Ligilactobacillus ruminis]MSA20698.1 5-methyltetrahydropteroyltriglutamate--homocysteine S-methyltransferase [Ligilactobacillus ruminis]MSA22783.1 5-methyltetrahydropteroyltriglutamate--homocysteine S-methyltransferase [Ligilactobacillus ruminis]MSA24661.1 5-methyltetrahydropteroyltriglutamate--homocysteine S-methyltransferase [Ligilactobacillus ruminis]MSA34846.1 5-methyltetrahydropteroyltriglutamate--homocysteine S-me
MTATIVGFPRIGENRELKFITEKYFKHEATEEELKERAKDLRQHDRKLLLDSGLTNFTSNHFSFYDQMLDAAFLFNVIPENIAELDLSDLDKYFALARGYQGKKGDVKAWPMKKWFNTNYHYIVPQFTADTDVKLAGTKIFDEFVEAKEDGTITRPVLVGPFTLLQLSEFHGCVKEDFVGAFIEAYANIFKRLEDLGANWIQLDEPSLVKDLDERELALFKALYEPLLLQKGKLKVLAQTYFGDVRDAYDVLLKLPFNGIGLDFVEGRKTSELVERGFDEGKVLFAGIVNGKNIWRNNYQKTLDLLKKLNVKNLVLTTSCSLLHVPYTVASEELEEDVTKHFAFAEEKVKELVELDALLKNQSPEFLRKNAKLFEKPRVLENAELHQKIADLKPEAFVRQPEFAVREKIQKQEFNLPLLPTTTIGSFPQTREVKQKRAAFRKHEISQEEYDEFIAERIDSWIGFQEEIGLDVLVHGEFERNDMVEYFGQHLEGYVFTKKAWVQSYGTRCVKPPIIWGDVSRKDPITVRWSVYAQKQTKKIVKGMLTGPVTILNWSFPREDISIKESTLQLALAIREEVLDLEKNGIRIIQIDEAALREKLPLRRSDWQSEYLDWAIPAFRLVHSGVKPETQIHTHMCYSEFNDIISAIDDMDADVISFEASRSNLEILDELKEKNFKTEVGPGVYDIHSPRIPTVEEIEQALHRILAKVKKEKVWVNPDCGLKTRGEKETKASLKNLTQAAQNIREEL